MAGHYAPDLLPPDMLSAETDPDPSRTGQLEDLLRRLASGGEADGVTTGLRSVLSRTSRLRLNSFRDLDSLTYLTCDEVANDGLQRLGSGVSRVCHYRVHTRQGMFYVTIWLAADGVVADFMPFRDFVGDGLHW